MGFKERYFQQGAEDLIEQLVLNPTPWLAKIDLDKLKAGIPIELPLPVDYKTVYKTVSGKIEILNTSDAEHLPSYCAPYGDDASFWLITAPTLLLLNSSFNERDDLLTKKRMTLKMNHIDAASNGLIDGQRVVASNERGQVTFYLMITPRVPMGVVVAEGVWWLCRAPGMRTVNALTSQRLTDRGAGSTFYDTKVDVHAERNSSATISSE